MGKYDDDITQSNKAVDTIKDVQDKVSANNLRRDANSRMIETEEDHIEQYKAAYQKEEAAYRAALKRHDEGAAKGHHSAMERELTAWKAALARVAVMNAENATLKSDNEKLVVDIQPAKDYLQIEHKKLLALAEAGDAEAAAALRAVNWKIAGINLATGEAVHG